MKEVTLGLDKVSGGNPVAGAAVAGGVGLAVFNGGADAIIAVDERIQGLNAIGQRMGENAFNAFNPNPMGQMNFNRMDFKPF